MEQIARECNSQHGQYLFNRQKQWTAQGDNSSIVAKIDVTLNHTTSEYEMADNIGLAVLTSINNIGLGGVYTNNKQALA